MGLRVDYPGGNGSITLPKRLAGEDPLFRMDIIGDWIVDLEQLYLAARQEFHEEMMPPIVKPPLPIIPGTGNVVKFPSRDNA